MNAKNDYKKSCHKLQAETVIKNLKKRGMDNIYCENSPQAVQKICRLIPGRSSVLMVGEVLGY